MNADDLVAALLATEPAAAADRSAIRVVRAPGRVNVIGEHTDYNDGFVLPAAIDLGISIAFVPTEARRISLTLLADGRHATIDLDRTGPRTGTWVDYLAGMASVLQARAAPIGGFRGVLAADLPAGAGLSSSAALELAVAWALGGGGAPIADPLDLARAARQAENDYVGVGCGLMDQFAVTFGVDGAALLLDCRSLEHRVVPIPDGVELLVVDSGISRRLAGSAYAMRQAECARAVAAIRAVAPWTTSLRDVDLDLLEATRDRLDEVAYRRARHVVRENDRVLEMARALEAGDVSAVGPILSTGHASLRDDFEVSTPAIDQLAEVAEATPGVLGARLTGAGFGGSLVVAARPGTQAGLTDEIARRYEAPAGITAQVLAVRPARGAGLVWPVT